MSTTMIIITTRDMISDFWLPTNSAFFFTSSFNSFIHSFIQKYMQLTVYSRQWLPICFWEMLILLLFPLIQLRKMLSMKHIPAPNEILWDTFFPVLFCCYCWLGIIISFVGNWRCGCAFEIDWIIKWWNKDALETQDAWMNPINECSGE